MHRGRDLEEENVEFYTSFKCKWWFDWLYLGRNDAWCETLCYFWYCAWRIQIYKANKLIGIVPVSIDALQREAEGTCYLILRF